MWFFQWLRWPALSYFGSPLYQRDCFGRSFGGFFRKHFKNGLWICLPVFILGMTILRVLLGAKTLQHKRMANLWYKLSFCQQIWHQWDHAQNTCLPNLHKLTNRFHFIILILSLLLEVSSDKSLLKSPVILHFRLLYSYRMKMDRFVSIWSVFDRSDFSGAKSNL